MKRQVYIVDDDAQVRRSTCFLLESLAYDCRAFTDGTAFLDELEGLEPGCVLLNLRMPRTGGLEVQAALARHHSSLPVIAMSGNADLEAAQGARAMGAIDVLEKPFPPEALLAALRIGFARLEAAYC